jgi:putative Mn2+ efflux pump MntP
MCNYKGELFLPIGELILLAISLGLDAFAVSIGCGSNGSLKTKRESIRLAFHFGLFQFLMPIIGWSAGYLIKDYVASLDHWIAFVLLSLIGVKMIRESRETKNEVNFSPAKGWTMIGLSVATSIDALVIGITLAVLRIAVFYPSCVIGIVTAMMSLVGIVLGKQLGNRFGKNMELAGGIMLILIGTRILVGHLFGW